MQPAIQLNDIFWTFQGEGKNSGRRSLFIRLPYCNYSCPWCDTEYNSINFKLSDEELIDWLEKEDAQFAVITGGEPTINKNFDRVVDILERSGFEISIETNGSVPIEDETFWKLDFITLSPKEYSSNGLEPYYIEESHLERSNYEDSKYEYKWVIDKPEVLDHALKISDKIRNARHTLSPEFNNMKESFKMISEFIIKHPDFRYSLQTHKWVDIK